MMYIFSSSKEKFLVAASLFVILHSQCVGSVKQKFCII